MEDGKLRHTGTAERNWKKLEETFFVFVGQ
jgi:hypothetical protein